MGNHYLAGILCDDIWDDYGGYFDMGSYWALGYGWRRKIARKSCIIFMNVFVVIYENSLSRLISIYVKFEIKIPWGYLSYFSDTYN